MKKLVAYIVFTLFLGIICPFSGNAQKKQLEKKEFKNTIRFNITNPMIFGVKSMVFGYERTLGKHQSMSINIGRSSIPKFFEINPFGDSIKVIPGSKDKGFNGSIDYRFYLQKENKYDAPHGVYIGPYYSFYFFERENSLEINTSNFNGSIVTDFKINTHTLGAELGYQFILWKRLALDLILIGPGLTNYNLKTSINTSLDPNTQSELFQKIQDALSEKIPGYNLVLKGNEFEKSGTERTTSIGFRYMINVGFRF